MLNANLKSVRKSKGLSQEELAVKLHVVRQTVSKWEQGLSVPDSDMLIAISEILETPVSELLGETVSEQKPDDLKVISEKLEEINLQFAKRKQRKRKILFWLFAVFGAAIIITAVFLIKLQSPYLDWNFADPETAVVGTAFHIFEFCFFRLAPFALLGAVAGAVIMAKRR